MNHLRYIVLFPLLLTAAVISANAFANDVPKAEFIKVTKDMMLGPCDVTAYMKCLGVKQGFCKKSVQASFKSCDSKVNIPEKIPRKTIQNVINSYGACMTKQITSRMKLTTKKLDNCESVLRASLKVKGKK